MNGIRSGVEGRASGLVLAAGLALVAAMLATVAFVGWKDFRTGVRSETVRGELLARLLEDHAARTFDTASIALASLAQVVAAQGEQASHSPRWGASLSQALLGLPSLRSVAVLDLQGRVLSSSHPADVGAMVDLPRLGPLPGEGRTLVGAPVAGRSLGDVSRKGAGVIPEGLRFVPLKHGFRTSAGQPLLLIGLLNPDVLGNYQQSVLRSEPDDAMAMLSTFDGSVLAATRNVSLQPGTALQGHRVLAEALPLREHGTVIGPGLGAGQRIMAFRALRDLPLVVILERPYGAVVAAWWAGMRWLLGFALLGTVLVIAIAQLAWRNLRARELARRQLDAAQARVAHSERELSVLVRSVQELIFRTDAAGVISFVNTRWTAVTGRAPEQAIGRRLCDIVQPSHAARVQALFEPDRGDGVRSAQVAVDGVGEGPRLFDLAVVPLQQGGVVIGFAGSAVDVTERHRAEQQLQAQLSLTGLLLEISPLPVAMTDPQGRLATVNQAWEAFAGQDRSRLLGRPAQAFIPAPPKPAVAPASSHGQHTRYEARVRHGDGSWRDVAVTQVQVMDADRRLAGTLSVLMDVSEYREAERVTREARDAAEEASRAKSEFIANISHEMRTPLQSIIGFSELGMVRGRAQPKLADMFGDIHAAGQRMLAVVNDLLDVAKIESTVGTFHLERTDLREVVRAVCRELAPLFSQKQLELRVSLPKTPLLAKVDPTRIQQVVRNVLANAIKFSPEGQSIALDAAITDEGEIHLRLRDHGPGIPAAELDAIFEAFVQSTQTKDGSGGTGLGLAICRKIVAAHGGRIQAENAEGAGGAVFHIFLPWHAVPDTAPAPL